MRLPVDHVPQMDEEAERACEDLTTALFGTFIPDKEAVIPRPQILYALRSFMYQAKRGRLE